MTLEQKIGSLLTLGFAGTLVRPHIRDAILKYHCGGLRLTPSTRLFGIYIDPKSGKTIRDVTDTKGYKRDIAPPMVDAEQYASMLDELQILARSRPLGIPLHFSFDQEGGTSADYDFGGVNVFPKPMGIRATGDVNLAYKAAEAVSRQSKAVGFSWIHSPVLDINTEPLNPEIYTRAYSDIAEVVAEYGIKTCEGFKQGNMIATGKHFPGRGHSKMDAHFEVPVITVDKETMLARELLPYRELIARDLLPSIMIAHSIFPAFDNVDIATVSKKIITGLLRDKMGFKGVITTDSMTMVAVRYGVANACALALEAGADLVLMKAESVLVEEVFTKIREFVKTRRISEEELDQKVRRVLGVKYQYGLFIEFRQENPVAVVQDKGIIDLSRHIARRSVMTERHKNLPLLKTAKILVIEQVNKTPNNFFWHPGILYKNCLAYNQNCEYLEVSYTFDDDDKAAITQNSECYDAVIITNFYIRGKLANNQFIEDLLKNPALAQKPVVVVTNTPYPISVPKSAEDIIVTYATSPHNIEVCAGTIFGEINPEGTYPIEWRNL
ncbi:MAG: hypothetical protein LBT13_09195 [Treponema sp.]|nr:hypothetical protein [Treponema sp.]